MVLLGIHFPTFNKTRAYLEQGDAPGGVVCAGILQGSPLPGTGWEGAGRSKLAPAQ
jgi:hypothetical protein